MDFKQLESFVSISELGSFSKAEEAEFISKQALLKQINNLESEVGTKLFIRSGTGVRLTEEGKVFLHGAKELLMAQNSLIHECRSIAHFTETLNLSNVEHQKLLTPVIREFQKKYPEIHINYVIHPNHSGEYRVQNRIMDVAETFYDPDFTAAVELTQKSKHVKYTRLASFPYVAVMSKNHLLSSQAELSFEDLKNTDVTYFLQITRKGIADRLNSIFADCPEHLNMRADIDNQIAATFECIQEHTVLVTCNPYIYHMPDICIIPLQTDIEQEYGILTPDNPSPTVSKFTELAIAMYRKYGKNVTAMHCIKKNA